MFHISNGQTSYAPQGSVILRPTDDRGPSEYELLKWFSSEKAVILELSLAFFDNSLFSSLSKQREEVCLSLDLSKASRLVKVLVYPIKIIVLQCLVCLATVYLHCACSTV